MSLESNSSTTDQELAIRELLAVYGRDNRTYQDELDPSTARRICAALAGHPWTYPTSGENPKVVTALHPQAVEDIISALSDELLYGTQTETDIGIELRKVLDQYRAYRAQSQR